MSLSKEDIDEFVKRADRKKRMKDVEQWMKDVEQWLKDISKIDSAYVKTFVKSDCLWDSLPPEARNKPMAISCPCPKCSTWSTPDRSVAAPYNVQSLRDLLEKAHVTNNSVGRDDESL